MKHKLPIIGLVGSAALAAVALAFSHHAMQRIGIGAAYKAKTLCSDVFVAERYSHEAAADLEKD